MRVSCSGGWRVSCGLVWGRRVGAEGRDLVRRGRRACPSRRGSGTCGGGARARIWFPFVLGTGGCELVDGRTEEEVWTA